VIPTEQNNKNGQLGETRTFRIDSHSADVIKKNINSANRQSLEGKNLAAEHHQQMNAPRSQYPDRPVSGANGQHPQSHGQGGVRSLADRPAMHQAGTHGIAPARGSNAASMGENGGQVRVQPERNAVQNRPGVQPNHQQVNHQQAHQPNHQQVNHQQQAQQVNHQQVNHQQVNHQQVTGGNSAPPGRPRPVHEERALRVREENLPEKRPEQSLARLENSLVNKSEQVRKTDEIREKRAQMMKTRKTDIGALKEPDKKNGKPEKEKIYSDEGGNTVVSIVKAVVYIIFVLVVSVSLALAIIFVGNDVFSFVKSDEIVEVVIPEFATLDEVADVLFKNDIIKYPTVFKLYAVAKKSSTDFLAGTYPVHGMMSYEVLLNEFREKPETGTVDITIPEGYTVDEIIDLFVEGYGIGTREGFVDVIENGEFDYWFIRELEENGTHEERIYRLEGYLFPDTYQFYKASSEWTVVNKMLKRFSQIFTKEYRNQCEIFGYTVDEMITLASMIEKEAGSPAEFFMVSSVFHNRLNSPWNFPKLESDATMVYVVSHEMGERTAITAADLDRDNVYNTYLYDGLPPGPIANPSASAMLAALSPQTSNYYFLIANKGVTYYSETRAQHDAYIAQFSADEPVQQTAGDMPAQ